jgi:hypothetical protein
LAIHINTPLGGILDPALNDVLSIYSIFYKINTPGDYSTENLVIQTNTYFSATQYTAGDTMLFKNYIYRDTGVYDESSIFNEFINQSTGHVIVSIDKSDPSTFLYNQIIICAPSIISTITGLVTNYQWYSDLKLKSMGTMPIMDISGKFINCSLQTQIVFNIKYLEKSTNFMNDLL